MSDSYFYDKVEKELDKCRESLLTEDFTNNRDSIYSDDKGKIKQALDIFDEQEKRAKETLEEMRKNAQWKDLHIAMYGETNAGKSTLIEALRIYFKDSEKLQEQKIFENAKNNFKKYEKKIDSIIKELEKLENIKSDSINLIEKKEKNLDDMTYSLQKLESTIEKSNKEMESKTNEAEKLKDSKNEYDINMTELDSITKELEKLENIKQDYIAKKDALQNELRNINEKLPKDKSLLNIAKSDLESNMLESTKFKDSKNTYDKNIAELEIITKELEKLQNLESKYSQDKNQNELDINECKSKLITLESNLKETTQKLESNPFHSNSGFFTFFKKLFNNTEYKEYKALQDSIKNTEKEININTEKLNLAQNNISKYDILISQNYQNIQSNKLRQTQYIESNNALKDDISKLDSITTKINALQNEITRLNNEISNAENNANEKEAKIIEYETILNDNIKFIESNTEKKDSIAKRNESLAPKIKELESLQKDIQNLKDSINQYNKEIETLQPKKEILTKEIADSKETLSDTESKIDSNKKKKTEIVESSKKDLEIMLDKRDGKIIGDGRPDFTRSVTTYRLNAVSENFVLLDVPGIEGNESLVIDEIKQALAKAHLVLYIKREPTPPQKGDDKKGIIEKVKEQLNSQAEIYAVYNKPIQSPRALESNLLSNDEIKELDNLDSKMNKYLPSFYKGHKVLSAKIAFLSLANNLLGNSEIEVLKEMKNDGDFSKILEHVNLDSIISLESKNKFLEKFSQNQLLDISKLPTFISFIQKLAKDSKEKIKNAHIQKANSTLGIFKDSINIILNEKYKPLLKETNKALEFTKDKLDFIETDFIKKCKTDMINAVEKSRSEIEKQINKYINKDKSDSEFKEHFKDLLENRLGAILEKNAESKLKERETELKEYIADELNRYKDRLQNAAKSIQNISLKDSFGNDIKIGKTDSGIEYFNLIAGVGGAALSVWGGMVALAAPNIWNPIGWTIIVASVIAGLLAFGKSIAKFFSSDYKKSEQIRVAREALDNIESNLKKEVLKQLDSINKSVSKNIENLKDTLTKSIEPLKQSIKALEKTKLELQGLESRIKYLL